MGALSRGSMGEVRLWTALDGSSPPIPAPLQGAQHLSLSARGDGWRIGIIDPAGSAQLWQYTKSGGFVQRFATSPHRRQVQIEVVPGGDRAVVLRSDHSVALLDEKGTELAVLQARGFRPLSLHLSESGRELIAVLHEPAKKSRHSLQRIRIGDSQLVLEGKKISLGTMVDRRQLAVSPDGKAAAFLKSHQPQNPNIVDVTLIDLVGGGSRSIANKLPLPMGNAGTVGFTNEETLLITSTPLARAWLVDLASDKHRIFAVPVPTMFHGVPTSQAFGGSHHAVSLNHWLYVKNTETGSSRYLGFRPFEPFFAAFSPDNDLLLWLATNDSIYIEPRTDAPVMFFSESIQAPTTQAVFVDDQKVVLLNTVGQLSLLDLRTKRITATADAAGGLMAMEYESQRKLLRVGRNNSEAWVWVLDLGEGVKDVDVFEGPHVVSHGNTTWSGLLAGDGDDTPALWTLDEKSVYRTYSLADLRRGVTYPPGEGGSKLTTANLGAPVAADQHGVRYHVSGTDIAIYEGTRLQRKLTLKLAVNRIVPSPDGAMFAVVQPGMSISVYKRSSGHQLWSYAVTGTVHNVAWTSDNESLAVVSTAGGVVLDAATGTPQHKTCGPWFEARPGPPPNMFASSEARSVCEL